MVEEHAKGLDQVVNAHWKAGLKLNPAKCHFIRAEVECLGHLVSGKDPELVPSYTHLIENLPFPTTRTGLRAGQPFKIFGRPSRRCQS